MKFELEKYLPLMEGLDASMQQKEEMLRTVWGMMESQVDQAFGMHPVQNCMESKKTLPKLSDHNLESIETTTVSSFNAATANDDTYKRKA